VLYIIGMVLSVEEDIGDELASIGSLHKEPSPRELIDSHFAVIEYWTSDNEKRELCYNWRKGVHWDTKEEKDMSDRGKAPIVFNKGMPSLRAIMGTFLLNRYDVKASPTEPTDQDASDVLKARYNWHHYHQNIKMKDKGLMEKSLVGGDGWQESYMIVTPGNKPRMMVQNQNDFAIYPDPNSIDLLERSDCEFIDRDSWMSMRDLISAFPTKANRIRKYLVQLKENETDDYEPEQRYANRRHETDTWKNGQYRVTERFYKVLKNKMWGMDEEGDRIEIGEDPDEDTMEGFKKDHPTYEIQKQPIEYLYLAIVCDQYSYDEFLFNGPYHCQPRNPLTGKIMFTLQQLVCEEINGSTNGIFEYQIGPNKLVNAMLSQELFNVKHEVNTAILGNPAKFTEDGRKDLEEHHAEGDRVFWTKKGETPEGAITNLPQSVNSNRNENIITWASTFQDDVSSSNINQQGIAQSGNVSGILDKQRSEQAFTQQVGMTENYRYFLTQRARLWGYYDRKYFTAEETFRLIEKPNKEDPEWITMNATVQDKWGAIKKANDITTAMYDYQFEDSIQSPNKRDKIMQQIVQLKQFSGPNADPRTLAYLDMYYLKMSDTDQDLKDFMYETNKTIQADQQQMQQQEAAAKEAEMRKANGDMDIQELDKKRLQIENDKGQQDLAQAEAEQTSITLDEQIANPIEQSNLAPGGGGLQLRQLSR